MLTRANRLGSAAVRVPSMVASMPASGTSVSLACISIRVTPHDDTAARNASLLVNASACGRDDESNATVTPRAALRARPSTPELDARIVSTLSWVLLACLWADYTSRVWSQSRGGVEVNPLHSV